MTGLFLNFVHYLIYLFPASHHFHQNINEDKTDEPADSTQVESTSAPQSEDPKPEETVSTEEQMTKTEEQETHRSSSPPTQEQEKVADLIQSTDSTWYLHKYILLCKMSISLFSEKSRSRGDSCVDSSCRQTTS